MKRQSESNKSLNKFIYTNLSILTIQLIILYKINHRITIRLLLELLKSNIDESNLKFNEINDVPVHSFKVGDDSKFMIAYIICI